MNNGSINSIPFLIKFRKNDEDFLAVFLNHSELFSSYLDLLKHLKEKYRVKGVIILNYAPTIVKYEVLKSGSFIAINDPKRLSSFISRVFSVMNKSSLKS
ncbi:MAG: hypothetical protein ACTSVA_03625 [Candidatus Njordarchaeales archaeon]